MESIRSSQNILKNGKASGFMVYDHGFMVKFLEERTKDRIKKTDRDGSEYERRKEKNVKRQSASNAIEINIQKLEP